MKLTVSFFDRGPSCPTDRARCLFFSFVLFVLFIFLFFVSFLFARARLHNKPAKVFPCGKVSTFSLLSLPFWGSNDCAFPVLPLHPPSPEKWSRLRWFFVDEHLITKMPTYEKPFQRPSPRRSFHDHLWQYGRSSQVLEWFLSSPNTEWIKARAIGWQLVLGFLFMLRKRRRSREGGRG